MRRVWFVFYGKSYKKDIAKTSKAISFDINKNII